MRGPGGHVATAKRWLTCLLVAGSVIGASGCSTVGKRHSRAPYEKATGERDAPVVRSPAEESLPHPEFSATRVRAIRQFMTPGEVEGLFGPPDAIEVEVFGAKTPKSWQGLVYRYRMGRDEAYGAITVWKYNEFVFESDSPRHALNYYDIATAYLDSHVPRFACLPPGAAEPQPAQTDPAMAAGVRWESAIKRARESMSRHEYAEAKRVLLAALVDAKACKSPSLEAITCLDLGDALRETSEWDESQFYYEQALTLARSQPADFGEWAHTCVARALTGMGGAAEARGAGAEAEEYYQQAVTDLEARGGQDDLGLWRPLLALADLCRGQGRLQEAERLYRRALAACEASPSADSYMRASVSYALGVTLAAQSKDAEAVPHLKQAYDGAFEFWGPGRDGIDSLPLRLARQAYVGALRRVGREAEAKVVEDGAVTPLPGAP